MKLKTYMLYVVSAMMLLAACNDMEMYLQINLLIIVIGHRRQRHRMW